MTILFVDDDPDDCDLFCEVVDYLQQSDIAVASPLRCVTVSDGARVIEALKSMTEKPSYVFLDINMPVVDGKQCLQQIKSQPAFADIPVIMFSTAFKDSDIEAFKQLGAFDFIRKPNNFHELVKILAGIIYRREGGDRSV